MRERGAPGARGAGSAARSEWSHAPRSALAVRSRGATGDAIAQQNCWRRRLQESTYVSPTAAWSHEAANRQRGWRGTARGAWSQREDGAPFAVAGRARLRTGSTCRGQTLAHAPVAERGRTSRSCRALAQRGWGAGCSRIRRRRRALSCALGRGYEASKASNSCLTRFLEVPDRGFRALSRAGLFAHRRAGTSPSGSGRLEFRRPRRSFTSARIWA
jgi:hypothetical protein